MPPYLFRDVVGGGVVFYLLKSDCHNGGETDGHEVMARAGTRATEPSRPLVRSEDPSWRRTKFASLLTAVLLTAYCLLLYCTAYCRSYTFPRFFHVFHSHGPCIMAICKQGRIRRSAELLAYAQITSHRAENVSLARPGAISETRILRRFFSFAEVGLWPSSSLDEKKLSRTLCLFISFWGLLYKKIRF